MTTDTSEKGFEASICTNASPRTASPSPGSFATVATRRNGALDIVLFVNGLPVVTFELKNNLTKQTVDDADPRFRGVTDASGKCRHRMLSARPPI